MDLVCGAKRILVCLRYGIGDVVMQLPILDALRESAAGGRITAAGAHPATQLLDGSGHVDEVVAYGRWGIRHLWDSGRESTRLDIADWLSGAAFELALDALHAPEPLWAAVKRIGVLELSTDEDAVCAALAGGSNAAEALARGAALGWGLRLPLDPTPTLLPSAAEAEFARSVVGDSRHPLVGFCPAASSRLKRWPESRFAAVADWAVAAGYGVIVFGDDHDETVATMRRLMSHGTHCLVAKGLHLRRLAALLARCAALVSNDTGLMHIAAAVRTPVVAIFGPTTPRVYLPRGRAEGLAAGQDCPHRTYKLGPPGCWNSERCLIAPDHCTAAVSTEAVVAALGRMLPLRDYSVLSATTGSMRIDRRAGT